MTMTLNDFAALLIRLEEDQVQILLDIQDLRDRNATLAQEMTRLKHLNGLKS